MISMPSRSRALFRACTNPGAGVDVAFGAQTGEGVVEVGREPEQQGFIFHLMSEYIAGNGRMSPPLWGIVEVGRKTSQ